MAHPAYPVAPPLSEYVLEEPPPPVLMLIVFEHVSVSLGLISSYFFLVSLLFSLVYTVLLGYSELHFRTYGQAYHRFESRVCHLCRQLKPENMILLIIVYKLQIFMQK